MGLDLGSKRGSSIILLQATAGMSTLAPAAAAFSIAASVAAQVR
jgi:hypothetical protein